MSRTEEDFERLAAELRSELLAVTRDAVAEMRAARPGETFYVFALFSDGGSGYVDLTANTEELASRSDASCRWSPCDWQLHGTTWSRYTPLHPLLRRVDEMVEAVWGEEWHERLPEHPVLGVFRDVLTTLDREGLFGAGQERTAVALALLEGDQSDEERLHHMALLNPPETLSWVRRDL